jgi:hypothetical protein
MVTKNKTCETCTCQYKIKRASGAKGQLSTAMKHFQSVHGILISGPWIKTQTRSTLVAEWVASVMGIFCLPSYVKWHREGCNCALGIPKMRFHEWGRNNPRNVGSIEWFWEILHVGRYATLSVLWTSDTRRYLHLHSVGFVIWKKMASDYFQSCFLIKPSKCRHFFLNLSDVLSRSSFNVLTASVWFWKICWRT